MPLRAWLCRQSWPIPPGAKVFWWHGVSFGRFHATLVTVTTGSLLQWDPSWWSKLLASDFGYRVPRVQLQIAIVASFDFQAFQIRIRQCQSSERCFPGIFDELMEIQTTRWPRNCCQGGLEWTERPWGQGKAFSIWGSRSLIDLVVIRFESLDPCDMFSEFPEFDFDHHLAQSMLAMSSLSKTRILKGKSLLRCWSCRRIQDTSLGARAPKISKVTQAAMNQWKMKLGDVNDERW